VEGIEIGVFCEFDEGKFLDYQDRSQCLGKVLKMSILLVKIRIFWESSGRRDIRDMC
jgi:hypothetical protein